MNLATLIGRPMDIIRSERSPKREVEGQTDTVTTRSMGKPCLPAEHRARSQNVFAALVEVVKTHFLARSATRCVVWAGESGGYVTDQSQGQESAFKGELWG